MAQRDPVGLGKLSEKRNDVVQEGKYTLGNTTQLLKRIHLNQF